MKKNVNDNVRNWLCGLVTGTCLAEVGNDVTCVDIDETKIAKLEQRSPGDCYGMETILRPYFDMLSQQLHDKVILMDVICMSGTGLNAADSEIVNVVVASTVKTYAAFLV